MTARWALASAGLRLSDWFERWFPDAFALAFGAGFWDLNYTLRNG